MTAASGQARAAPRTMVGHCHHRTTERKVDSSILPLTTNQISSANFGRDLPKRSIQRSCRPRGTCPSETARGRSAPSDAARRLHATTQNTVKSCLTRIDVRFAACASGVRP
jgi:hypothetical protein